MILGAAGQISRILIDDLLDKTNINMTLYGRNLSTRLLVTPNEQITIVDGDFNDKEKMIKAMHDINIVYLNAMESPIFTKNIVDAMDIACVKRLICSTIAGVENEVPKN